LKKSKRKRSPERFIRSLELVRLSILEKADLETCQRLFPELLQLKRGTGKYYKMRCPFHTHRSDRRKERTPSFMIRVNWRLFHCFGCGFRGDIINYCIERRCMTFIQAVIYLAKKLNIRIEFGKNMEQVDLESGNLLEDEGGISDSVDGNESETDFPF
jgi:DNA primase